MYKIVFENFNHRKGFVETSAEIKPLKVESLLYYIEEENDHINFCTGVSRSGKEYFNTITIPKNCICEKPLRLLLQPNLDFIECE